MHVLINDFIGGYLRRGIPQFVSNLELGLIEAGHRVTTLRAPRWFERLPRSLAHAAAVVFEQGFVPFFGRAIGAECVLYPYNSIAALDMRSGRGRIVVHDLELLSRPRSAVSRRYAEWCYRRVQRRGYPVFTVSESAREALAGCPLFQRSEILVLPNVFFRFERTLRDLGSIAVVPRSVILCTGHAANKDLASVASTFLPLLLDRGLTVHVVGLHTDKAQEVLAALAAARDAGRLVVHGRVSDEILARLYAESAFVWVHSRAEGFGRPIVEGRLAGRPVVCSDIPPFHELADDLVRHYSDPDTFMLAVEWALDPRVLTHPYDGFDYRAKLQAVVGRLTGAV